MLGDIEHSSICQFFFFFLMLLPARVDLYCIRLSMVFTDMLYSTVEGWQHVMFSHHCSLLGVDHLIVFEMNRTFFSS